MNDENNHKEEEIKNNKDITDELLDFDIPDDDDGRPASVPAPEDRGDHPGIALLDMAISTGADFARREKLPPPNQAVYDGFSRPFLNTALWHYFPDGDMPDDPRIAVVAGIAGLGLACAPTLIALHERRSAPPPEPEGEEKTGEKRIKNPVTGSEYRVADRAGRSAPPAPSWMDKLRDGAADQVPGV